jgi:hypothetical protein
MNSLTDPKHAIPRAAAMQLCTKIRQKHSCKWYSLTGLQCWGCTTFSKGDPAKMCFSSRPDYRGCNLVNTHFDRIMSA